MNIGHFRIPGEATRREYAVYVMIAQHHQTSEVLIYVGKTGDNRKGCNPVISRAGNHLSLNAIHSQMRNKLPQVPWEYDFDFFFTTFGCYVDPDERRDGIELINEMERQLNRIAHETIGPILNPLKRTGYVNKVERLAREALATPERITKLKTLVEHVRTHLTEKNGSGKGTSLNV